MQQLLHFSEIKTAGYSLYCQYTGDNNLCFDILADPDNFYPDAPPDFDALGTNSFHSYIVQTYVHVFYIQLSNS